MRRRDTLDPEVERELAALDAALAGDPADAGLAAFVRDVRAERPPIPDGLAARLDARAASGFAPEPASAPRAAARRLRLRRPSRRVLLPALGAAATVLVAIVVAGPLLSGTEESEAPLSEAVTPTSRSVPDDARGGALATPGAEPLAPGRARRIERRASLVLTASGDEVPDVADSVIRATDEVGGIVVTSSVSSGDEGRAGASFQLRVPARRLDEALAKLSKLGHVRSRTQSSQDVTGSFVSARERLDESLAERRGLLGQLARADTPNETASIRARLRIVQAEIRSARASVRRLRTRTDFSAVSVTVEAAGGSRGGGAGGTWTPGDAIRDAIRVLEVTAGVLLVSLAVLLPVGLLAAALSLGARTLRRRRRESALSAG